MIEPHDHDRVNSPPIAFKNLIPPPITAVVPTDAAQEGTIRIYNSGSTYRIYVRVNKGWHYASLT